MSGKFEEMINNAKITTEFTASMTISTAIPNTITDTASAKYIHFVKDKNGFAEKRVNIRFA